MLHNLSDWHKMLRSTAVPYLAMRTENILIYRLQVGDQPNSFLIFNVENVA